MQDGDRVLIIEDVITAGTAVRQSIELLRATAAVRLTGLIVGVDRMERGEGERSALAELEHRFGMKTRAIVTIDEVVEELRRRETTGERLLTEADFARIAAYRAQYGAKA